jgi:hypothetical protein
MSRNARGTRATNYSQSPVRAYRMTICDLGWYRKRPANRLTPEQVRRYQAHLFRDRKVEEHGQSTNRSARFFFIKTLRERWDVGGHTLSATDLPTCRVC